MIKKGFVQRMIAAVLAAALVICLSGCCLPDLAVVSRLLDDPDFPVIEWNEDDPEGSFRELGEHLMRREQYVGIRGGEELEWMDVCSRNFWVDTFSVSGSDYSSYKTYEFYYLPDADECEIQAGLAELEADSIIACIPEGADDFQKVLTIHDELIRRTEYTDSEDQEHIYDLYGALVLHKAVCQGYTFAMAYILDQLGIKNGFVWSEDHIWTYLPDAPGGEKYVDVTWDDIDENDSSGDPYILHNCLFVTADEMSRLEKHSDAEGELSDESGSGNNYYRRAGGYINKAQCLSVSSDEIARQYELGRNVIELRFEDEADYEYAAVRIGGLLRESGYTGAYIVWNDDNMQVLTIGLNCEE